MKPFSLILAIINIVTHVSYAQNYTIVGNEGNYKLLDKHGDTCHYQVSQIPLTFEYFELFDYETNKHSAISIYTDTIVWFDELIQPSHSTVAESKEARYNNIIVKSDKKYGLYNPYEQETILSPIFDRITYDPIHYGIFFIYNNNKTTFIHNEYLYEISDYLESLIFVDSIYYKTSIKWREEVGNPTFIVQKDGKFGICAHDYNDSKNIHSFASRMMYDKIVLDSIFVPEDEMAYYCLEFLKDSKTDRIFMFDIVDYFNIDNDILPIYDHVQYDFESWEFKKKPAKSPFKNVAKNITRFDRIDGLIKLSTNTKSGLYDYYGDKLIIDVLYDSLLWNENDSTIWALKNNKWGLFKYQYDNKGDLSYDWVTNMWFDSIPTNDYLNGDTGRTISYKNRNLNLIFKPNEGEFVQYQDTSLKVLHFRNKPLQRLTKLVDTYQGSQATKPQSLDSIIIKNDNIEAVEYYENRKKCKYLIIGYDNRKELRKHQETLNNYEVLCVFVKRHDNNKYVGIGIDRWIYSDDEMILAYSNNDPIKAKQIEIIGGKHVYTYSKNGNQLYNNELKKLIEVEPDQFFIDASNNYLTTEKSSFEDTIVQYSLYTLNSKKLLWQWNETINVDYAKDRLKDSSYYYDAVEQDSMIKVIISKKAASIATAYSTKKAFWIWLINSSQNYDSRVDYLKRKTPVNYYILGSEYHAVVGPEEFSHQYTPYENARWLITSNDTINIARYDGNRITHSEAHNYIDYEYDVKNLLFLSKVHDDGLKYGVYANNKLSIPIEYDYLELNLEDYYSNFGYDSSTDIKIDNRDYIIAWKYGKGYVYDYNLNLVNEEGFHKIFDISINENVMTIDGMQLNKRIVLKKNLE